ncbi:hypothetical protein C8F04DRAFT_1328476 [Mycena alexandri]|uniref:Uncharacterized protein n=1 Tax=Mycena alexandri TaxID=1745969 RepID=A0AAD6WLA3_9AGAR|nr:hypothetical protein C8F04DRAFT_1328476 [Mycena alexandri]
MPQSQLSSQCPTTGIDDAPRRQERSAGTTNICREENESPKRGTSHHAGYSKLLPGETPACALLRTTRSPPPTQSSPYYVGQFPNSSSLLAFQKRDKIINNRGSLPLVNGLTSPAAPKRREKEAHEAGDERTSGWSHSCSSAAPRLYTARRSDAAHPPSPWNPPACRKDHAQDVDDTITCTSCAVTSNNGVGKKAKKEQEGEERVSSRATENACIKEKKKGYNIRRTGERAVNKAMASTVEMGPYVMHEQAESLRRIARRPRDRGSLQSGSPTPGAGTQSGIHSTILADTRTISSSPTTTKSAPPEDEAAASSSRCTIVHIRNPRDSKETAPYNEKERSEKEIKEKGRPKGCGSSVDKHYTDSGDETLTKAQGTMDDHRLCMSSPASWGTTL